MATLNIGGRRVKVDDSFLSLPPDQQQATVDEIAGSIGAMPQASSEQDEPSIAPPTEGAAGEFARAASAMTQNPAKAAYDALPEWQKPIVAASDVVSRSADGLMFGFGDEIAAGIRAPISGRSYTEELAEQERLTNAEKRRAGGAGTVAELAGGRALALPSAGGAAVERGHGLGRVALGSGIDGALVGGLTGFSGPGSMDERLDGAESGAKFGGVLGIAAPFAVAAGSKLFQKAVSPFASSAERSKAVETLAREGVETTAGQKTGSKNLRYLESEIGGAAASDIMERQGEQFTKAALKRAGISANRASPEVIDEAFERIGQQFDDLAARNVLKPDDTLVKELRTAYNEYGSMVPPAARAPIVDELANDIVAAVKTQGQIDGAVYQSLRSRLERMARRSKADPDLSGVLRDFRGALDSGMERSILRTNPKDAGAWNKVRKHYRNMLVLEDAVTRAGENAAQGLISPSALRGATKTKQGTRAYARGQGDFADLARAGEAVLKPLPDSGTASRTWARNLGAMSPAMLGAGGGGYYGAQEGGLQGAIVGALGGMLAPRIVGQMMMSKTGQRYLANQLLRSGVTPEKQELIRRVLNYAGAKSVPALTTP
jgi:hypothetical protein